MGVVTASSSRKSRCFGREDQPRLKLGAVESLGVTLDLWIVVDVVRNYGSEIPLF
jgi:hypothetical protein